MLADIHLICIWFLIIITDVITGFFYVVIHIILYSRLSDLIMCLSCDQLMYHAFGQQFSAFILFYLAEGIVGMFHRSTRGSDSFHALPDLSAQT